MQKTTKAITAGNISQAPGPGFKPNTAKIKNKKNNQKSKNSFSLLSLFF
jgi:hypothetical protein